MLEVRKDRQTCICAVPLPLRGEVVSDFHNDRIIRLTVAVKRLTGTCATAAYTRWRTDNA